jgi:heme-degrading monooxygenase HmoA
MQHVRVALYTFKSDTIDEVIRRAETGMLPTFRRQPGFVSYSVVKTGDNSAISITVWQSREQAEAAVQTAASWVRENIASMVETVQNHIGDLAFFSSAGTMGT